MTNRLSNLLSLRTPEIITWIKLNMFLILLRKYIRKQKVSAFKKKSCIEWNRLQWQLSHNHKFVTDSNAVISATIKKAENVFITALNNSYSCSLDMETELISNATVKHHTWFKMGGGPLQLQAFTNNQTKFGKRKLYHKHFALLICVKISFL